jgi:hypothetical protein
MPFPLSKVRSFDDYNGHFALSVKCAACAHERTIPAVMLSRYAVRGASVQQVVKRLRCSRCQGRDHSILVVGIPR